MFLDLFGSFVMGVEDGVDGVEIDGQRHECAGGQLGADFMGVGNERAELLDPADDPGHFAVEEMRAVGMDSDAIRIGIVVSIAGDVVALVDDVNVVTGFGKAAGMDCAGKPRADDEDVSQPGSPKISTWSRWRNSSPIMVMRK